MLIFFKKKNKKLKPKSIVLRKCFYNHLKNRTSDDKLISSYDGIGIAKALKFQHNALANNPKSTGSELFGGRGDETTGSYNPVGRYPCRWWQLSCHLNQIFGDDAGGVIMDVIVVIIKNLLGAL